VTIEIELTFVTAGSSTASFGARQRIVQLRNHVSADAPVPLQGILREHAALKRQDRPMGLVAEFSVRSSNLEGGRHDVIEFFERRLKSVARRRNHRKAARV
jgi:hypothetical protein